MYSIHCTPLDNVPAEDASSGHTGLWSLQMRDEASDSRQRKNLAHCLNTIIHRVIPDKLFSNRWLQKQTLNLMTHETSELYALTVDSYTLFPVFVRLHPSQGGPGLIKFTVLPFYHHLHSPTILITAPRIHRKINLKNSVRELYQSLWNMHLTSSCNYLLPYYKIICNCISVHNAARVDDYLHTNHSWIKSVVFFRHCTYNIMAQVCFIC